MRVLGKVLLGIIALVVVLGAAAGILLATFNPNSYKTQIETIVQNKTGRALTFGGDIKVVFYPILGFEVSKVNVGNPPGFPQTGFLQVDEMEVGVKLIPLLHKQIELTTLRLKAPVINLLKRKDGHTNFEAPAPATAAKAPVTATAAPGEEKQATAQQVADLQIEKLDISDASLTYEDQTTGKTTSIQPFNLKLGNFRFGREAPLSMDLVLHSGPQNVSVKLSGKVNADPNKGAYQVSGLQTNVAVQPAQGSAMNIAFSGDAAIDQKAQTIDATNLHVTGPGLDVTGTANVKGFSTPAITFTLNALSIDLAALPKASGGDTATATTTEKTAVTTTPATDNDKPLLPLALLRTLNINGTVTIGSLKASKLTLENIKTTVVAHGGVLTVDPLGVDLYKGHLSATAKIDARTDTPTMALKGQLQNLDMGELLKAQMGDDYVTGSVKSDFDLTTSGNTMRALQSNSGGKFSFAFGQGTINKWQLSKLINEAMTVAKGGLSSLTSLSSTSSNTSSDELSFSSLSGSFTGKNGLFSNSDLQLLGPQVHAAGNGTVDLRQQQVDYTLNVGLGSDPTKFANNKTIPIKITGPLSKPSYSIDTKAVIAEFAGKKIDKLLSKISTSSAGSAITSNPKVKNLLGGLLGSSH